MRCKIKHNFFTIVVWANYFHLYFAMQSAVKGLESFKSNTFAF
jgi:hypothetical protein